MSQYDSDSPTPIFGVPGLLVIRRLRMEGFIVFDHRSKDDVALAELSAWKAAGKLVVPEDVIDGLENAPRGLIGLLAGENRGKRMIRIAKDPA